MENYYSNIKKDYESYSKIKKEIELYRSGKIRKLLENYYNMIGGGRPRKVPKTVKGS